MNIAKFAGIAVCTLMASACANVIGPSGANIPAATVAPPAAGAYGSELFDASLRAVSVDPQTATTGAVNTVHFRSDGIAHSYIEPSGPTVTGRWWIANNNQLCFNWPVRGQECWPYASRLQPGQTVILTSTRGQTAQITLLSK